MHIGFTILQYAKLCMLEFFYDFIDKYVLIYSLGVSVTACCFLIAVSCRKGFFEILLFVCLHRYVDRREFQYIEMDSDSTYMALSALLHLVVRPGKRRSFYENYGNWFLRPYCEQHRVWLVQHSQTNQRKHDTRTPRLFKVKFEGTGMVALNSKTYHFWGSAVEKTSSNGFSKQTNKFTKKIYKSVL